MKEILKRFIHAKNKKAPWDRLINEAYHYVLPNHEFNLISGQQRDKEIFDSTAINALQQKKAKIHSQLFPPFDCWMDFYSENSPKLTENNLWHDYIIDVQNKFHAAIEISNFHIEIDTAIADACVSTGCLMINQGSPDNPLHFESVPINQLIPEESPNGKIQTIFREWDLDLTTIQYRWPDALLNDYHGKKDEKLNIIESIIYNYAENYYDYYVFDYHNNELKILTHRLYSSNPAITFRINKAPGEWMGRGPVLNVLGDIKTANKVVELILKNASIAVTGIWQADEDGILSIDDITLTPGTIIPKAPGSAGLQPLASPGKFDVSQIILAQLQNNIKIGILGQSAPIINNKQQTAFEINARIEEYNSVEIPNNLRLINELVIPLANRILAILSSPEMAGSPYYISPFLNNNEQIKLTPKSPLIRLQNNKEAYQEYLAFKNAQNLFPEFIDQVVDIKGYLREYLQRNNRINKYIIQEHNSNDILANLDQSIAKDIATIKNQ